MATKESILMATLDLACENGLGAVSLSQIAKKVGIQKATIYSHFASKDQIIESLYVFLREKARAKITPDGVDYGKIVKGKTPLQVLNLVVDSYVKMNTDADMSRFYNFIVSESVYNAEAAKIMVAETEKMLLATKQLFYAMQALKVGQFYNVDAAAVSFAMTVHSILDYKFVRSVAGVDTNDDMLEDYLKNFCKAYIKA